MRRIVEILSEIRPEIDPNAVDAFLESGSLDSLDLLSLVATMEEKFGVVIDGAELVPDNFSSLAAIEALISKSQPKPAT